jgi:hypothetical protein
VYQFPWRTAKEAESIKKAAMQGLLPLGMRELQIQETAVALDSGHAVEFAFGIAIGKTIKVAPIYLHLGSGKGLKADEGPLLPVLSPYGFQVIVYDRLSTVKPEKSKAPANHLTTCFGINTEHLCDLVFEGIKFAGSFNGRSLGVGVVEIPANSVPADLKSFRDCSNTESEVL